MWISKKENTVNSKKPWGPTDGNVGNQVNELGKDLEIRKIVI